MGYNEKVVFSLLSFFIQPKIKINTSTLFDEISWRFNHNSCNNNQDNPEI